MQDKKNPGKAPDELIRLNKYIADAGIASRRKADELIASGKVKVNDLLITDLGHKVKTTDVVKVNNTIIKRTRNLVYVLLNKPKDFITTTNDPQDRHTVMELIKNATSERVYPVGRLDRNTTGVLLFTNDGELAQHLTHPSSNIKKVYSVHLNKSITSNDYEQLLKGIQLDDGKIKVDNADFPEPGNKRIVGVEIHSGKNRIVRRIFEHLGYEIDKLDRVMFASLTKKNLNRGKWRLLSEKEVRMLKQTVGKIVHKKEK